MNSILKKKFFLSLLLLIITFIFSGVFYFLNSISEQKIINEISRVKYAEILILSAKKLQKIWFEGDQKGAWKSGRLRCSEALGNPENVDDSFLRCNPSYLDCYIHNYKDVYPDQTAPIELINNGEKYKVFIKQKKKNRYYTIVTKNNSGDYLTPNYGVKLKLYLPGITETLEVVMEDSCSDVYLPQKQYKMHISSKNINSELVWDNFGRHIFIDKYMVSVRDIKDWIEYGGDEFKEIFKEVKIEKSYLPSFPATNLTLKQMKSYCKFRGKHLLNAHTFDASTFLPSKNGDNIVLYPYPWNKRKSKSFLNNSKFDNNFITTKKHCNKVYTKECLELLPFKFFSVRATSWSGIYNPLGGYLEVFRNPYIPTENLKASSFYFNNRSDWHQLGRRAYWDGSGFTINNFLWEFKAEEFLKPDGKENNFKVGFRCMRSVANEE